VDYEDDLPDVPQEAYSDQKKHEIDDAWLISADEDHQVAGMAEWFGARFWDPANETPYISSEGGYIWVHGGPYDAREQLGNRFGGTVSDDVIERTAELLESGGIFDWAPTSLTYYDEEQDVFVDNRGEPTKRLQDRLEELLRVLALEGHEDVKATSRKLIFAGMISALETFLWETMVYWVDHDDETIPNIITKVPAFMCRELKLGQIFEAVKNLQADVRAYLQNLVWHQFEKVAPLMKHGLSIELPSFRPFQDAIKRRHDIVHRSGHDAAGNAISVSEQELRDLSAKILDFATSMDTRITAAKTGK
jgi:hypothetical protein